MLKINYEDKSYSIKNTLEELLIKDYEKIASILNDEEKLTVDKWSEVMIYLGIPQDIVEDFDAFVFRDIIKEFNIINVEKTEIPQYINVDGKYYAAYDENFKLTVKELALIEKVAQKNKNMWVADVMSIIYKNPSVDKTMRYDSGHLKHKADLIRENVTADKAIGIIEYLSKRLIKDYQMISENG
jgi:hypothetical protein